MKYLLTLATVLLLGWNTAKAQEYKTKIKNTSETRVNIAIDQSDLQVEGYDGNDLVIRPAHPSDREPLPERAKGLKPLYNSAVDNTGIGLSVEKEGNNIHIVKASRGDDEYIIRVPRKVSVSIEQASWMGSGDLDIKGLQGEVEVQSKNADVNLEDVTGPIIANSVSGDIVVKFSTVNRKQPTSISNVSGIIDIALPGDTPADFSLKSITGEIYTDFDMNIEKRPDDMRLIGGGSSIEGKVNGGGVDVTLKTISSNIYVRKQK